MLTHEQIEHLALLARLKLAPEEFEQYRADLTKIVDYVGELREISTEGTEALHHVLGLTNVLRRDDERMGRDERLAGKLIAMSQKEKDGFVAVPRVLYHEF
ncbi:MAG: Asp-tRNA(Asn)/Glu-tRNA(Gln) amidotransferase subunit GatC [bacterium]|nr:Asp-tRNA(Asn)/Glu-tRNA(Gln) amidotransferase subunit GatC [bacterium]MDZ4296481.1 Asp-tRNA(Asn)/Glu-tRNA(Gln) amidotransferase subunit GatC [Patescibacteria group bacterium]